MHALQRQTVFLEPPIHNPILEVYRRLTPHLRSPTERAFSMGDIAWMGSHFRSFCHRKFILLSIVPVLAAALVGRQGGLAHWQATSTTPRPCPTGRRAVRGLRYSFRNIRAVSSQNEGLVQVADIAAGAVLRQYSGRTSELFKRLMGKIAAVERYP